MRIGFDISSLSSGHQFRGLGFYTQRLLNEFKQLKFPVKPFTGRQPSNVDLVHYPAFTLFTLPPKKTSLPAIVTLHDLIPLKYPQHYPLGIKGRLTWYLQKKFLQTADAIITDSQASKKDIVNLVSISAERIQVIYLAADSIFKPLNNPVNQYHLPKKFVLYVGDLNWNKNIVNLAQTCLKLNYPLVVVGRQATASISRPDHPELKDLNKFQQLAQANPDKIIRLGFIPTKDLVSIYNLATCYCQPSRAEGFGLPVLEAMACGCPVITSKTTSLAEISGQAALLINPYQPSQLTKALKACWQQPKLRAKMAQAGIKQAKQFSWQKTARQTIKVYEKII